MPWEKFRARRPITLGRGLFTWGEIAHKGGEKESKWRRAWDLNPRRFPLPVFKTGALGRYASPPWSNLLEEFRVAKSHEINRVTREG